ncbi:Dipeptidyl-peptidase 5 [Tolypocladium ophioglossoides CBS 100239]|uniref:Dipeptidyl-peptidase V n=1 Tax=Tolypocladium ophioglossoides (strain CBS 100239) TaxID=1163406 RepID=A0A0L0N7L3_TOLOC|nr:Dipeptidyl-peptidase 5 [Tolypocladium ophioglossoides CBS 100239]
MRRLHCLTSRARGSCRRTQPPSRRPYIDLAKFRIVSKSYAGRRHPLSDTTIIFIERHRSMVVVQKLTAEALIGAPRRGPAMPNRDGRLALYSVSTHVFGDGTLNEVRVMDIGTGTSATLSDEEGVHDAVWIPGTCDDVLYLKSSDKGRTQAIVASGRDVAKEHYVAAEFDAPVANLKLKALDDASVAFVVTGLIENGLLYNETIVESNSSARVFDTPNIRMWNEVYRPQRYTLWYNKLELHDAKWTLPGELLKLIDDPNIEAPHGMYGPDNPGDHFDICHRGIAFIGRDVSKRRPHESSASVQVYVPIESFSLPPTRSPVRISSPSTVGVGVASNMRFAPNGLTIAFLHVEIRDGYNTQLYLAPVDSGDAVGGLCLTLYVMNPEHEPPRGFEFAGASNSLIVHREKCGRSVLDHVDLGTGRTSTFFRGGVVAAFHPLRQDDWDVLLVSSSSFIDSSLWQVTRVSDPEISTTVSSATKNGARFGLSADMVSEFWFEGADDVCVHCFMIKPSNFDADKTYPWVLRPHGGPVASWTDSWSVIVSLAALNSHYNHVADDVVGKLCCVGGTGLRRRLAQHLRQYRLRSGVFSEYAALVARVLNEWGGKPFQDLKYLIGYLEQLPFLDPSKAVLMGGSYAGYLFCCAVCHDGIFSTPSFVLQEDSLVDTGDYGNSRYPWENPGAMQKCNPARPELLRNWENAPPTLIIHSEKDYRCPITEGLAAFNTLQAMNVPSRFLTFADEGHWVEGPENSLEWYCVVWDWVGRCVNGEIERGSSDWCKTG